MHQRVTLRTARADDLEFLFEVSTEAMRPVTDQLHPRETPNGDDELRKYKKQFEPSKVQVIQYDGQDVGRLRVVRTSESIYVGGIQILPAFQNKGIGTAIFINLIEESQRANVPVVLEVHDVNVRAMKFYKKFGFVESGKQGNKTILKTVIAQ